MLLSRTLCILVGTSVLAGLSTVHGQQTVGAPDADRALRHASFEWKLVEPYLPDPATASPARLETEGDVLRARRLPEDAVEYYGYALRRGGDVTRLYTRMAVAELEMHHPTVARLYLKRVVELHARDAQAWNDLGAAEFMCGNTRGSIADYRRAVKLSKKTSIFHANLGTSYFEMADYEAARQQYETALRLDPDVFARGGWGGNQIEVLSKSDRGRFCFEMARLAVRQHADAMVLEWLGKSAEAGFDIKTAITADGEMSAYRIDTRVALIVKNAQALRGKQIVAAPVPPLPATLQR